ncbi:MAG: bifunctional nuclease family protein [bacterium]
MSNMVEAEVFNILLDKTTQSPVLLLKEKNGNRVLPIWIGFFEAESIMMALKGIALPRPMTHDLCSDTICLLGGKLLAVHIHTLEGGTFYARLLIDQNGTLLNLDSRPSDAVSIALRQSSPILISEKVMAEAGINDFKNISSAELEEILNNLPDEAYGKYKM